MKHTSYKSTQDKTTTTTTTTRRIPRTKIAPPRSTSISIPVAAKARDSVVILRNKAACGPITADSKCSHSDAFKQLAKSMIHQCNDSINKMGADAFAALFTFGIRPTPSSNNKKISLLQMYLTKSLVHTTSRDVPVFFMGNDETLDAFMKAKRSEPMKAIMTTVTISERYNGRSPAEGPPDARVMSVNFQVKGPYAEVGKQFKYHAQLGLPSL